MIVQTINLYQDRFKEKRQLVSSAQVMTMLGVLLLGLVGWSILIGGGLSDAEQENRSLKANQDRANSELAAANVELEKQLADGTMSEQISSLSREVGARKQVVRFVENNQFGSGQGFSSYLVSLANLRVDNVWLEEISLGDRYLKIGGSALSADLIPIYFTQFSEESVFQGQRFQLFELDRKTETDWKVDFVIATEESLSE